MQYAEGHLLCISKTFLLPTLLFPPHLNPKPQIPNPKQHLNFPGGA